LRLVYEAAQAAARKARSEGASPRREEGGA